MAGEIDAVILISSPRAEVIRRLLRVDGILTGRVESFDTLVVGKDGRVDAEVIVGALQVHGLVKGRIAVDKTIEIFPGGRVEGDVYASAPGVNFE